MRQSDYEKQYTKEINNALPIGIVSLVIFIITGMVAFWLYQKSEKVIGNDYEIMEVMVVEKHKNHPVRGSEKYYIHGRNMDGYEQMYWVRERVYNAVEIGDVFVIYKYHDCYGSTLSSIVDDNAGTTYKIFEMIALMSLPFSVMFSMIGFFQKIRNGSNRRGRYRKNRVF